MKKQMIDALKVAFIAGYHHCDDKLGKPGFNEWFHDKYSDDVKVCRMCDTIIPSSDGMYVEDGRVHCCVCHPMIYSDDEWKKLHDKSAEFYYWTTAP